MVPYLTMMNDFGDPRSTPGQHQVYRAANGEQGVIPPREVEYRRMLAAHGLHVEWIPKLEFFDPDTGERLYTVADDPDGVHVAPANPTVEQQTYLQNQVQRQQEIIDRLLEVSGLDKDALPHTYTPTDAIPVDVHPDDTLDIPVDESVANDTQSPWAHSDGIPTINEDG